MTSPRENTLAFSSEQKNQGNTSSLESPQITRQNIVKPDDPELPTSGPVAHNDDNQITTQQHELVQQHKKNPHHQAYAPIITKNNDMQLMRHNRNNIMVLCHSSANLDPAIPTRTPSPPQNSIITSSIKPAPSITIRYLLCHSMTENSKMNTFCEKPKTSKDNENKPISNEIETRNKIQSGSAGSPNEDFQMVDDELNKPNDVAQPKSRGRRKRVKKEKKVSQSEKRDSNVTNKVCLQGKCKPCLWSQNHNNTSKTKFALLKSDHTCPEKLIKHLEAVERNMIKDMTRSQNIPNKSRPSNFRKTSINSQNSKIVLQQQQTPNLNPSYQNNDSTATVDLFLRPFVNSVNRNAQTLSQTSREGYLHQKNGSNMKNSSKFKPQNSKLSRKTKLNRKINQQKSSATKVLKPTKNHPNQTKHEGQSIPQKISNEKAKTTHSHQQNCARNLNGSLERNSLNQSLPMPSSFMEKPKSNHKPSFLGKITNKNQSQPQSKSPLQRLSQKFIVKVTSSLTNSTSSRQNELLRTSSSDYEKISQSSLNNDDKSSICENDVKGLEKPSFFNKLKTNFLNAVRPDKQKSLIGPEILVTRSVPSNTKYPGDNRCQVENLILPDATSEHSVLSNIDEDYEGKSTNYSYRKAKSITSTVTDFKIMPNRAKIPPKKSKSSPNPDCLKSKPNYIYAIITKDTKQLPKKDSSSEHQITESTDHIPAPKVPRKDGLELL